MPVTAVTADHYISILDVIKDAHGVRFLPKAGMGCAAEYPG